MNNIYFVSFQAGTSGRFVSSIVWGLINELDVPVTYTGYNSAHVSTYWALSWDHNSIKESNTNYPKIYEDINFIPNYSYLNPNGYGLVNTHIFPNFNTIERRFPKAKIIILTYDSQDIFEICLNNVLKNGLETFKSDPTNLNKNTIFNIANRQYFNKNSKKLDIVNHEFSMDEIVEITEEYQTMLMPYLLNTKFTEPIIPDQFKGKILILGYRDLFKETKTGYLGLDLLCGFTNTVSNDIILESYSNYVKGRQKLISLLPSTV